MNKEVRKIINKLQQICDKYFDGFFDEEKVIIKINSKKDMIETEDTFDFYIKSLKLFSINQKGEIDLMMTYLRRLDSYAIYKLSTIIRFAELDCKGE